MRLATVLSLILIPLVLAAPGAAEVNDWYASDVVSWSTLGASPYDSPNAVLGPPTIWFRDPGAAGETWACSIVVSSWNLDPGGDKIITTVNPGGHVTAMFTTPIEDDPDNWYGLDFIVFGNAAFNATNEEYLTPDTDMEQCFIVGGGLGRWEPSTVSVAQYPDGPWHDFSMPTDPRADGFAPLQAFAWDNINHAWGAQLDFTKPLDPDLEPADFGYLTVAQALDLYRGAAGGAAFDVSRFPLPVNATGRKWIRYIKVTGSRGEVDAFSRVGHAILPVTAREAKGLQDGAPVIIPDLVVSAGAEDLGDCCYAQSGNRACGIRLNGRVLSRGQKVTVYGVMATSGGERAVDVTAIEDLGMADVKPLGVANSALSRNTQAWGLLVRTWGTAKSVNPVDRTWLVDDGSGSPVKCSAPDDPGFVLPVENAVVTATGPCSCEQVSGNSVVAVVRVRDQQDLN